MAIQGTQVPMYTKYIVFVFFWFFPFFFSFWKKNKIKLNNQTKTDNQHESRKKDAYTWRHDRKMQMHENMIPKVDKKSSKESHTLDRKN